MFEKSVYNKCLLTEETKVISIILQDFCEARGGQLLVPSDIDEALFAELYLDSLQSLISFSFISFRPLMGLGISSQAVPKLKKYVSQRLNSFAL